MAENCWLVPRGMVAVVGLIEMAVSVADVTDSVAAALLSAAVISMTVWPAPTILARPAVCGESLIVAMLASLELQCPVPVMSLTVPSVYVPVAVNCCVNPSGTDASGGAIVMETSAAAFIVSEVDPLTPALVAVMFADPLPDVIANPVLLIFTRSESEVHEALEVKSWVVPSLNVPMAVNCWLAPEGTEELSGDTFSDTSAAGDTVMLV